MATPADADAVLALMRELADHEGLTPYFTLTRAAMFDACFGSPPRFEVLVAADGDEIVGYATLIAHFSPWMAREYLFLDDLYVSTARRRSGIGLLLMRGVGAIALERDLDVRWHVETVNASAQSFYRSLGADLRDRFIAYWSRDAIRESGTIKR